MINMSVDQMHKLLLLVMAMVQVLQCVMRMLEQLKTQVMFSCIAPMIVQALLSMRNRMEIAGRRWVTSHLDRFGSINLHYTECLTVIGMSSGNSTSIQKVIVSNQVSRM